MVSRVDGPGPDTFETIKHRQSVNTVKLWHDAAALVPEPVIEHTVSEISMR